ncbi:hypothetical protein [Nitrosomonas eutropha]|uniref:hypothetical protein n=1 Tax=Nitrosomonas eutropha TaxID=916 RepID=UPI0008D3FD26|nr:hypothetical protein [Nitrosomonas eutropha]SEJ01829.1 hypothetical protein SAMN05216318_12041 [Nitrosomonas eutropha]
MDKQTIHASSIPHSKEAIRDMVIAGAFVAMGILLPNGVTDGDFASHIGGIALGTGIGWLVKSFIGYRQFTGAGSVESTTG